MRGYLLIIVILTALQTQSYKDRPPVPHKPPEKSSAPTAIEAAVAASEKANTELARRRVEAENEQLKKELAAAKKELDKLKKGSTAKK